MTPSVGVYHDFLVMFTSNFTSVMHRFRDDGVFLQNESDVNSDISATERQMEFHDAFRRGYHDFLVMFSSNFTSVMHRF